MARLAALILVLLPDFPFILFPSLHSTLARLLSSLFEVFLFSCAPAHLAPAHQTNWLWINPVCPTRQSSPATQWPSATCLAPAPQPQPLPLAELLQPPSLYNTRWRVKTSCLPHHMLFIYYYKSPSNLLLTQFLTSCFWMFQPNIIHKIT